MNRVNFKLQQQTGDDVVNNKILKFSGGGKPNQSYTFTNFIKYDSNKIQNNYFDWGTRTESERWIKFDFCNRKINQISYIIQFNKNSPISDFHPKSWWIDGSNHNDKCEINDHWTNNSDLVKFWIQKTSISS